MSEIEDLKIQISRMQAMIIAQQQLLAAICGYSQHFDEIIKIFNELHSAGQTSMHFEPFSDSEINDHSVAHDFLLDYLNKTTSWLTQK
jgi:hypothetical protein